MIAFLRGEPSASAVREAIEAGASASWINLGELLYIEARRVGFELAELAVESMAAAVAADEPDRSSVKAAARIKADGGASAHRRSRNHQSLPARASSAGYPRLAQPGDLRAPQ
jgi:predicted nucleic acid-binding protein